MVKLQEILWDAENTTLESLLKVLLTLTFTAFTLDQLEEMYVELSVKHTAPFLDTLATVPTLFTQTRPFA